jgi:RND superfamily putative drug exporter
VYAVVRLIVGRLSAVVAVLVLGVGVLLVMGVGQATHDAAVDDALPAGADSTQAARLQARLPQSAAPAVVLFTERDGGRLDPTPLTAAVRDLRVDHVEVPAKVQEVPSRDGEAALAVVSVTTQDAAEVGEAVTSLRHELRANAPAGVRVEVTGPAAVQADLAAVFDGADFRLLAATASVVALLLVITYRSPVLWVVPLLVVGVADQAAAVLATQTLAWLDVPWDASTTGILSVLVFGAGTDYALLLISRYRDELHEHDDRYDAMRRALSRTTEAVLSSATTVVIGVLCLALSLIPTTRALGIACAVGVVVAVVFALTALPATLVLLGRWVFWPRVPRTGAGPASAGHRGWRRVADAVARRPGTFAAVAIVLLAVLSTGLLGTRFGLPQAEQFLKKPEAISAAQRLAAHFPAGSADPVVVMTTDPRAAQRVVAGVDGVDSVRMVGSAGAWSELDAVLSAQPDSAAARGAVQDVRSALEGTPGTSYVGGTSAEALDARAAAARDRLLVIPLVLVLVLLALVVLLRSLVAPVVLVLTVVGTYLAALGVSWWLFQGPLGFSAVDEQVPLLAFLFLVALGVDYNIFLVTRIREESGEHGHREGVLRGLATTGGVITSAGILLAAVFAVLGVLPLVVLAQLGVVICIGVLLDTLLVRTVLVPALALLLGPRFWWPGTGTRRRVWSRPVRPAQVSEQERDGSSSVPGSNR